MPETITSKQKNQLVHPRDRDRILPLAEHIRYIASLPENDHRKLLWKKLNDRIPIRPMVYICQVPWAEMDVNNELHVYADGELARKVEIQLRRILYAWCHFRVDMIVEPVVYCPIVFHDTGFGIKQKGKQHAFYENSICAQSFESQIRTEADLKKIQDPVIEVDWETTYLYYELLKELFNDILEVRLEGVRGIWFAPWDELIRWYGVQEALEDLVLRPEFVHVVMERLIAAYLKKLEQYEQLGLLSSNNGPFRVGSGGLGLTASLPIPSQDAPGCSTTDMWGCAAAQIFAAVSPEMHAEFALRYEKKWLEKFGLNYYGCCEPLHDKIPILKTIPNLRKVSLSPKADLEKALQNGVGENYVISWKPNPAFLAGREFNLEGAKRELERTLQIVKGYPLEIILKDISTVQFEPRRLWEWAKTVTNLVSQYA